LLTDVEIPYSGIERRLLRDKERRRDQGSRAAPLRLRLTICS